MDKHLSHCRTNLREMFQNYGSDCTCGHEFLVSLLKQNKDKSPDELATLLNHTLSWNAKRTDDANA